MTSYWRCTRHLDSGWGHVDVTVSIPGRGVTSYTAWMWCEVAAGSAAGKQSCEIQNRLTKARAVKKSRKQGIHCLALQQFVLYTALELSRNEGKGWQRAWFSSESCNFFLKPSKKKTRACGSEADLDPDFFLSDPEQGGKKDLQTWVAKRF